MVAPYLDIYPEINNGAHRKAADLIGAPALVWHQALWNAKHEEGDRIKRAGQLQAYIRSVHSRIGSLSPPVEPPLSAIIVEPTDRVRVITLRFMWEGMRCLIRFEIHTEYLAITSVIDLSVDMASINERTKEAYEEKYEEYKTLKAKVIELQGLLCLSRDQQIADPALEAKAKKLHVELYEKFWNERFDQSVLDNEGRLAGGELGRRFADFRGFVSCEKYPDPPRPGKEELKRKRIDTDPLMEPFQRTKENERGNWHRIENPGKLWAHSRVNRAWPFLTATPEIQPGRSEYTVSQILDGLMIYASSLAPQSGAVENSTPLYFYLHSATQNERQIGRVIDRLCQLGTLRLAAIIALPALKTVSQSLRDVEHEMHLTRKKIQDLIAISNRRTYASHAASARRQDLEEEIAKCFAGMQEQMAKIAKGDSHYSRMLGDESLDYRLARSQYYRNQFASLVDDLRIKRLEGYQPYKEFVRRRLDTAHGYLDAVERRLRDIKSDLRGLDQLYLTTNITILTGEIDHEQRLTQRVQTQIKSLQVFAEAVLLLILAPYYSYALIAGDYLGCNKLLANCENRYVFGLKVEGQLLPALIAFFAAAFVVRNRDAIAMSVVRVGRRILARFAPKPKAQSVAAPKPASTAPAA